MRRSVQIGTVTVIKSINHMKIIPDDRQKILQISGGNWVEDYGHIASGDRLSNEFILTTAGWATVKGYWLNRTPVSITDEDNTVYNSRRVVVKSYQVENRMFPDYYRVELEFWNI